MKKLMIMMIALMMCIVFNSCNTQNSQDKELITEDSLMNALNLAFAEMNAVSDSVDSVLHVEETCLDTMKNAITIVSQYTAKPNSACGVNCNIIWKNLSNKNVKYAKFDLVAYNAVNDIVGCTITEDSGPTRVSVTGPIKPNETSGSETYWDCVWYNCTIKYMKIVAINIEYTDGSIVSTTDTATIEQLGYSRKRM